MYGIEESSLEPALVVLKECEVVMPERLSGFALMLLCYAVVLRVIVLFSRVFRFDVKGGKNAVQPRLFLFIHLLLFHCVFRDLLSPNWLQLPFARNNVALWPIFV